MERMDSVASTGSANAYYHSTSLLTPGSVSRSDSNSSVSSSMNRVKRIQEGIRVFELVSTGGCGNGRG